MNESAISEDMSAPHVRQRSGAVDAAKTAAIFGTILIHASANGGFGEAVGSFGWTASLFWGSVLRCAVPVFFLCSGALLLPPEKEVTVRKVWTKYIPRILIALLFWAAMYEAYDLAQTWHRTGVLEAAALRQAVKNLLLFQHKSHLYYLHIILLVYAVLPLTRLLVARADGRLLRYGLLLWAALGIVLPTARAFPPFSMVQGIPAQYPINLTWSAVGYGVLGYTFREWGDKHRPGFYVLLYLAGFALTFLGTLGMSMVQDKLYLTFLQGTSPGVCLEAAGVYGFCVSAFADRKPSRLMETVSRASFCVYLVHLFFLEFLVQRGFSAAVLPPVWAVPALTGAVFALSFAVWLVLRQIPVVNRYLI